MPFNYSLWYVNEGVLTLAGCDRRGGGAVEA